MSTVEARTEARAVARGMKPLAEIKPPDPRTFVKKGGVPTHLVWLFRTIMDARSNMPVTDPYDSEVVVDRMLAGDLDHALRLVQGIAAALNVELTL